MSSPRLLIVRADISPESSSFPALFWLIVVVIHPVSLQMASRASPGRVSTDLPIVERVSMALLSLSFWLIVRLPAVCELLLSLLQGHIRAGRFGRDYSYISLRRPFVGDFVFIGPPSCGRTLGLKASLSL